MTTSLSSVPITLAMWWTLHPRRFLTSLVLWACLAGCGPGTPEEGDGFQPFFFIQMADTQLGMFAKDTDFEKETELFERAVAHANRLKPRFVVICGDLINSQGDPAQQKEFLRISRKLDTTISLYLVSGNHDVGSKPTGKSLSDYREVIGADWYRFEEPGLLGIVLNSSLIYDPDKIPEEYEAQLSWLKDQLDRSKARETRHVFVFVHHPFFLTDPLEENDYFNLPLKRRIVFLDLFRKQGVPAVFAGHYHRNSYGRNGPTEMITTGPVGKPLGDDPSGFRIVRVYEDHFEHAYHGLDSVPESISLKTLGHPSE